MFKHRVKLVPALLAVVILLGVGCTYVTTPPGPDMAGGVYVNAGYEYVRWQEGLAVMIWYPAAPSASCNSSGSTSNETHVVQCKVMLDNDQGFDWQMTTTDGVHAEFSLANRQFDLSEGNVFIVSPASDPVDIQQLQRDLSGVKPDSESIVDFGLNDVDISAYIQSLDTY